LRVVLFLSCCSHVHTFVYGSGESTLSSEMDNAILEIGDDDFDY